MRYAANVSRPNASHMGRVSSQLMAYPKPAVHVTTASQRQETETEAERRKGGRGERGC